MKSNYLFTVTAAALSVIATNSASAQTTMAITQTATYEGHSVTQSYTGYNTFTEAQMIADQAFNYGMGTAAESLLTDLIPNPALGREISVPVSATVTFQNGQKYNITGTTQVSAVDCYGLEGCDYGTLAQTGGITHATGWATTLKTLNFTYTLVSSPAARLGGGYYHLANGQTYYANGEGQYCSMVVREAGSTLTTAAALAVSDSYAGFCWGSYFPGGVYSLPSGLLYYSNGSHHYCYMDRTTASGMANTPIVGIPPGNSNDGTCAGW